MKMSLTTDQCSHMLQALQATDGSKKLDVMLRFDMAINIGRLRNVELAAERVRSGLICRYSDPAKPNQVMPDKAEEFIKETQALGDKVVSIDLEPLPREVIGEDVPLIVLAGLTPILVAGDEASPRGALANGHAANHTAPAL
jgi:hypothetical protein